MSDSNDLITTKGNMHPCKLLISDGGEGGIRTHGTRKGSTVFETARFNHSRTSPVDTNLTFSALRAPGADYRPTESSISQRSPKKPAATTFPGWRSSGGVVVSITAKSGSFGICR